MPVAFITAMTIMGKQLGVNRLVTGTKIPHPCGEPSLSVDDDKALRREIVMCALKALEKDVEGPTVFEPNVTFTSG